MKRRSLAAFPVIAALSVMAMLSAAAVHVEPFSSPVASGTQIRFGARAAHVALQRPATDEGRAVRVHVELFGSNADGGVLVKPSGQIEITGGFALFGADGWDGIILDPKAQAIVRLSDFGVLFYW